MLLPPALSLHLVLDLLTAIPFLSSLLSGLLESPSEAGPCKAAHGGKRPGELGESLGVTVFRWLRHEQTLSSCLIGL